ncbi:MAG: PKD domain-containing protein [Candidatus Thermoplasmatota archaeon]|nr:PKD domain-containing protein [Candidatus Thermoplasmatota archaeon]
MKLGKAGKMATALTVLLLVLSGLVVVQWNAQTVKATEHSTHTSTVEGFLNTDNIIESNLNIKLRNLQTGEIREQQTSEDYYEFTDVKSGQYEIVFPSQLEDGYAYMRTVKGPFRVEDDHLEDINIAVKETDKTLEGIVVDEGGEPIMNASVTLQTEMGYIHTENTQMIENDSAFEIDVYSGFQGSLKIEKEGYAPNITTTFDDNKTTYQLFTEPVVRGRLVDQEGSAIKEQMDITLYNEETGIIHRNMEGPTFIIRAPADYSYILVVDAEGYEPLVEDIGKLEGDIKEIGTKQREESEAEQFDTDMTFTEGFETLTVESERTLGVDTRMKTLDHSFIGNLPMQIDLALGNGDQSVSGAEVEEFQNRLEYSEADIPSTYEFITVNDTVYELTNYNVGFENFGDLEGPITELFTGNIKVTATKHYEPMHEVEHGLIDLTLENDYTYGNERNFNYSLKLPDGYERYIGDGSEEVVPENVNIDGYNELEIDPTEDGDYSDVILDVRESEEGELDIVFEGGEPWRYEHPEEENYTVIKKDTELKMIAEYMNPVSRALSYTWSLGGEEIGTGEEVTYAFNESGEKELELAVVESNNNTITDDLTILVDDEGPQGDYIEVNGENVTLGDTITVDEDKEIYFNASNFEDVGTGTISNYEWNFTDVNQPRSGTNLTNISHTFDAPGSFDVILNLSDPVGNWNEEQITVNVSDTTEPMVVIKTEWDEQESREPTVEIEKNTLVNFNATESKANPEYEGNLTYEWEIEELGVTDTGPIMNYTFSEVEEYTVSLIVTDEAGNSGNKSITVNILRGDTPDLMVTDLKFSTSDIQSGDSVTISVNISNEGEKNATQINPVLKVNDKIKNIDPKYLKDGEELNNTIIETDETITMEIKWEPGSDGDKTITVNVTAGEEPEDLNWDNEVEDTVTVEPPAWREYIIYALIPIIIIGVTVGLYFYKDKIKEKLS